MSLLPHEIEEKLENLKAMFSKWGGAAIAFSGGVDSTLLLEVAHDVLKERCLAIIAVSSTYPKREFARALAWVKAKGIAHIVIESEELDIPGFSENPPDRCYYCKHELFTKVWDEARRFGAEYVADGANADDVNDFRPGIKAARELGVRSPLMECDLSKEEIRLISRVVYDLPTADMQSMACMSSRIPYGSNITQDKLNQIETVEDLLSANGFKVFRARHHDTLLRLELGRREMELINDKATAALVIQTAKQAGFRYVTVDLQGFRSGSMNEVL